MKNVMRTREVEWILSVGQNVWSEVLVVVLFVQVLLRIPVSQSSWPTAHHSLHVHAKSHTNRLQRRQALTSFECLYSDIVLGTDS